MLLFLHPIGQAIAALYPLPNRNGLFANFVPLLRSGMTTITLTRAWIIN